VFLLHRIAHVTSESPSLTRACCTPLPLPACCRRASFGIGSGNPAALSLVPDTTGGALYLASAEGLFEVVTKDEGRDMWRLHLARREYAAALAAAPTPGARERVHVAQGEAAFAAGDRSAAAAAFAKAPGAMRFEDAALRLLASGDAPALRAFLRARLDATPRGDRAAATLLATWLTELYLHALAGQPPAAEGAAAAAGAAAAGAAQGGPLVRPAAALAHRTTRTHTHACLRVRVPLMPLPPPSPPVLPVSPSQATEFRAFLRDHGAALDVATTRRLLAEFGRTCVAAQTCLPRALHACDARMRMHIDTRVCLNPAPACAACARCAVRSWCTLRTCAATWPPW
jgi:hypothetical protein